MFKRVIQAFILSLFLLAAAAQAYALEENSNLPVIREYLGDGIKITSYSTAWNSEAQLQSVYKELLNNFHGEEVKLLSDIYLYPYGENSKQGEYNIRYTRYDSGKMVMLPGRSINIYDCNARTTLGQIARTLAHEYGHHFTYYYVMKNENKSFEDENTLYQKIRGLEGNPSVNNGEHRWNLAEIAAEDYVAYFGSPAARASAVLYDITDYQARNNTLGTLSSDIFNLSPQENMEIPLAAVFPAVRDYWLKASGYKGQAFAPLPSTPYLYLDSVSTIDASRYGKQGILPSIRLRWAPAENDEGGNMEYTVVAYADAPGSTPVSIPVKTVRNGGEPSAIIGYYEAGRTLYTDGILDYTGKTVLLRVYVQDAAGNINGSNTLRVDARAFPEVTASSALSSGNSDIRVLYDDSFINFTDVRPQIIEGRTLVPLRKLFEVLGASVAWNSEDGTITARNEDTDILLKIGSNTAYLDGMPVALDVAPQIINARTVIPLRFIGESFGKTVDWDAVERVVVIK